MSPQSTTSQSVEREVPTGIKKCAPGTPAKNLRNRVDLARDNKIRYSVKLSSTDFEGRQAGSL